MDRSTHHSEWRSCYKYNLLPLLDHHKTVPPRYVEFRQHQGTLSSSEMKYWILFVCGLFKLAVIISDSCLERLVHLNDLADVSITELFLMMAVGNESTDQDMLEMMRHYSRKIMSCGTQMRGKTKFRLRRREAGAREIGWKDLSSDERITARPAGLRSTSKVPPQKRSLEPGGNPDLQDSMDILYECIGTIEHIGATLESGHYKANVKYVDGDQDAGWVEYNDKTLTKYGEEEIVVSIKISILIPSISLTNMEILDRERLHPPVQALRNRLASSTISRHLQPTG